jgi:hypothetical protein
MRKTKMVEVADILNVLARQYQEIKSSMASVKVPEDGPSCEGGFVLGLQKALENITEIMNMVEYDSQKAREVIENDYRRA